MQNNFIYLAKQILISQCGNDISVNFQNNPSQVSIWLD